MRFSLCILLLLGLLLCAAGCGTEYDEEDFLGKTSAQIVMDNGEFDCVGKAPDADGLYKNTACGYTVREARKGFLDTKPELLFFISFDENGVATGCYEGYRPGG